jgi:hypothetical protein
VRLARVLTDRGPAAAFCWLAQVDEPPASFVDSFTDTFAYLRRRYGGIAHVKCRDGWDPSTCDVEAMKFAGLIRSHGPGV